MAVEGLLQTIALQGFSGMLGNLASSYVDQRNRKIIASKEEIKTDLMDHVNNTFLKCTKVKTILNTNTPANTLEIYVDQRFRHDNKTVDQYDLVERIKKGGAYVITGTGGGGKSMFMRYLWLSFFENPLGRIPFFLELRNLNRLTHENFEDFIYHSIIKAGSRISQSNFREALKGGEFVLFLDGFDEINFDRRDAIQSMILDLQEHNPSLTIVVTSRPDERFIGWPQFDVIDVLPLTLKQTTTLIERAPYDDEQKALFLYKLKSLYEIHKDFLSNPLLAYMMLVTFSFNPDIPHKMFLFYEQAFEALYHRHDLTKSYRRKFHSDLSKQDFIRLVSFFCLKTYYDQDFEFNHDSIVKSIDEVKEIESINVDSEKFLKDMIESVCLLKIEGLTYTFTHRSFQEYLSAYCIARVAIRNVEKIFSIFSRRYSDSVMTMVYDINPDLFREKYIIPLAKKYESFISRKTNRRIYESFAERTGATFFIRYNRRPAKKNPRMERHRDFTIHLGYDGEMESFYQNIRKLFIPSNLSKDRSSLDELMLNELIKKYGQYFPIEFAFTVKEGTIDVSCGRPTVGGTADICHNTIPINKNECIALFRRSGMYEFLCDEAAAFISRVKEETAAYKKVSTAFNSLF